jgi:hypothetical protein
MDLAFTVSPRLDSAVLQAVVPMIASDGTRFTLSTSVKPRRHPGSPARYRSARAPQARVGSGMMRSWTCCQR